jgi:hypothetical protein
MHSFLKCHAFDDDSVRIMSEAYDAAARELPDTGHQPALVREVLAKRIIDIAGKGWRDPRQLEQRALDELGIVPQR